jgi:branched-chain amino acid transport system ATP-binding protein
VLLELRGVSKAFGGLRVLDGVGLSVGAGTVHALIGPNGSGKTTLLNCISGIVAADAGEIRLDGRRIDGLPAHRRTGLGVGRTFQNIRLFAGLSVLDNVLVGRHCRTRAGLLRAWTRPPFRDTAEESASRVRARALLAMVGLAARAEESAEGLPLADQRRLEIARALAGEPAVVLLDEPAAGMNATETAALKGLLDEIRRDGTTILLIEHDMKLVMSLCDRVLVLDYGRRIAEGPAAEVQKDEKVIAAYLGGDIALEQKRA